MKRFISLLSVACTLLSSCTVMQSRQYLVDNTPVTWRLVSEVIDEEVIQHSIKFRNVGRDIVSFDYTIVDAAGVPHVDAQGPNSGLVENLYPGAEVLVKNPLKDDTKNVNLGRLTFGKRTSEQLAKTYTPWQNKPAAGLSSGSGGLLPLPEPPVAASTPGE
jgi:hypothetical protein